MRPRAVVGVLIAAAAAATWRLPVAVVVKADMTGAATAAAYVVEGAVAAGVGGFTAAATVVALVAKATSAFPDNSIQTPFASVRIDTSARPRSLARYAIGRDFWMASRRGRSRFVAR